MSRSPGRGASKGGAPLIEKLGERIRSLNYIKRVHQGDMFWFNVIRISPDDILNYYHPSVIQRRCEAYFYLGISISPLLHLENGVPFIRACDQLMVEYDYHFSTIASKGIKILKAMVCDVPPAVKKSQTQSKLRRDPKTAQVTYQFLRTPNIPAGLSYREVVFSLCDVLTFAYRKLMTGYKPNLSSQIVSLDSRFKKDLFGRVSKDINNLAMYKLKKQGDILSSLYDTRIEMQRTCMTVSTVGELVSALHSGRTPPAGAGGAPGAGAGAVGAPQTPTTPMGTRVFPGVPGRPGGPPGGRPPPRPGGRPTRPPPRGQ